jgi:hypothetical protein
MRRKSGKSEKIVVLMEPFMGLLLKLDLRNPKKMEIAIDVGYMNILQGSVLRHILFKKTKLVQQANLVQNEMFQLYSIKSSK